MKFRIILLLLIGLFSDKWVDSAKRDTVIGIWGEDRGTDYCCQRKP
jgi:hypothetical protein